MFGAVTSHKMWKRNTGQSAQNYNGDDSNPAQDKGRTR